ncbi:MAG: DNA cytosine methyltransferase, partial [Acidobacteriota bacterium]|nr:DNA cytosine methyltransferase [Acidobacteriota bacterium]
GMSAGLRASGFEVIAGADIERNYMNSFRHNFPNAKPLLLDLAETNASDFMEIVGIKPGKLDLLVGGPPCQGFSKNVPRRNRYLDDPNNRLMRSFLDYCEALHPTAILMENVAEMKNGFDQAYSDEVIGRLDKLGYTVSHAVLNAADYGVPQKRRRAFFLAMTRGVPVEFPLRSHSASSGVKQLFELPKQVTVWDAIGDLPSIKNGEGTDPSEYASEPFSEFQKIVRKNRDRVSNHVARQLKAVQFERLAALKPGQGLKHLPPHLKVRSGYSGAYGRLTEDMIAPTITRWVFHPGSGRWGHPRDIRVLTIREAARIQGFPDDFEFVGSYTQNAGQVGNAVPPLLIERLASKISIQLGYADARRNELASTSPRQRAAQGIRPVPLIS